MTKLVPVLFKLTFRSLVILFRLLGLLPYSYNTSDRCFYPSTLWLVYSGVFTLLYITVIGFYTVVIYLYLRNYYPEFGIVVTATTFSLMYICPIVTYTVTLTYYRKLRIIWNTYIRLWYALRSECSDDFDHKLLSRFLFKTIVIDWCSVIGSMGIRAYQALIKRDIALLFQAVCNSFGYVLGAATMDLFLIAAYLGAHYFRLINYRVRRLNRTWKDFEQNQHYWRLNPKRKLATQSRQANELKKLIAWHGKVNQLAQDFVRMQDASLLMMNVKDFVIVVTGIFLAYVHTVTQMRRNGTLTIGAYGNFLFASFFYFCQFFYLTESGAIFAKRVNLLGMIVKDNMSFILQGAKTGVIIDDMSRRQPCKHLDVKIECYSLELLHHSSRIWNAGMYAIDYSLMYAAIATMTNYLIVSVQSKMSE